MSAEETDGPPISPATLKTLLVDNDKYHAQAMRESLERDGYPCTVATSGPEGAKLLEEQAFDIVVTDLVMDKVDGMKILDVARGKQPEAAVIMVTGHGSVPLAVEAMQKGAYTFLEKPITPQRLRAVAGMAAEAVSLRRENRELTQRLDRRYGFESILHASPKMKRLIDLLKRIAPTDVTVLIQGESGTGKELVAQAIHQNSPRKRKPFVAVNCAALPETLVESELFGHVKGAFTDAMKDRQGVFEYADGGTLFLDEVGDMPLSAQVKLLRVLQERTISRVGDNKPIPVDVRVLSATNRDLGAAVERGEFRKDLYYRLKVCTADLPPLRARPEDLLVLADAFRNSMAQRHHKKVKGFTSASLAALKAHDWPGNVRELQNVVESMVVLDLDGVLDLDDLPSELGGTDWSEERPGRAVPADAGAAATELIGRTWDDIERWAIENTLKFTSGNREEAARVLDIGVRTIYRKLEKYAREEQGEGEAPSAGVADDDALGRTESV